MGSGASLYDQSYIAGHPWKFDEPACFYGKQLLEGRRTLLAANSRHGKGNSRQKPADSLADQPFTGLMRQE